MVYLMKLKENKQKTLENVNKKPKPIKLAELFKWDHTGFFLQQNVVIMALSSKERRL